MRCASPSGSLLPCAIIVLRMGTMYLVTKAYKNDRLDTIRTGSAEKSTTVQTYAQKRHTPATADAAVSHKTMVRCTNRHRLEGEPY